MSRIRYLKTKQEGLLQSAKKFHHPTNGGRYRILLNLPENQWMVVDDESDLVAASGFRVHRHKMKIDARKALAKLGVLLPVDKRKKRKPKTLT